MDTSPITIAEFEPSKSTFILMTDRGPMEWDANRQRWVAVNAKTTIALAQEGLSAFEDLPLSAAAEIAQWSLIEILRDHTDDPADIALIERIERRLRPELFTDSDRQSDEAGG
jgi:hypothetical protein